MFFITNPYLMLAKRGGSLPIFQGDEGSSEVDLTDSDGDGIPDNAVIEDGSAYWTDENGNVQMANINPQGDWEMASNDGSQGGGTVDPATGLTFRQAFRQARNAGQETFMWNGNSYNTKTESEEKAEGNNEEVEEKEEGEEGETDIDEGIDDETIDENDELTDLEKAQLKAQQADLGFRNPDQATILSGIGDNPILELADAIERGVKSFGADEYYDPGSKEDYMKYTVRNVSDQDMVYDPEDRLKAMYNPGKYLKTNKEFEDEIIEEGMMDFYKKRRKEGAGGKDMYGRVKDFDADQFRETGVGATYGRKGPGFGDELEQKYQDASYLGFSNVDGNVRPLDYLTRGPGFATVDGDPNTYIRQDFEGSSTFDRSDDSVEWQRSMRNPLNQPITLPKIGPTQIPLDNTEPELIRANEPVDSPTDYQEPGSEDLIPLSPNMVRYGGGLTRYQDRGQVNEEDLMIGPDGQPLNIMIPTVDLLIEKEEKPEETATPKKSFLDKIKGNRYLNALYNNINPLLIADNTLQVLGIPAALVRESIEGIGGKGDGKFNFGDILPDLYNTTILDSDKKQQPVSQTLGVEGFFPSLLVDLATDPTTYVGAGVLKNLIQKGGKSAIPQIAKSSKNIFRPRGGKKSIDEAVDYSSKYINDPDYLRYMNTEKVRIARDFNNRSLNFDLRKKTGKDYGTISIHDKINTRTSFDDIINPNKPFTIGGIEQYRPPFLFRSLDDLKLGLGDFRNTYDDLLTDAKMSGFISPSKARKDIRTSSGIFYPSNFFSGRNANRFTTKSSAGNLYNPFPEGRFYIKRGDGSTGVHEFSHFLDDAGRNFSDRQMFDLYDLRNQKRNKGFINRILYPDFNYYTEPTEIKARMMEMRFAEGLMPGDKFTMDMLKKYTQPSLSQRLRQGFGIYRKGDDMFGMQPYLNLNTPAAQQNFLNVMNRYKKDGGSLPKAQQLGEFNNPTLGLTVPSLSGYSLSGNQPSPFATPGPSLSNPTGLINTSFLTTPTTEDQYKPMTDADMYASSQAVQRSMDSFDAYKADLNKRMENPSLSMFQVDTNPLSVPKVDFSPSPELQKSLDVMDYTMAEQEGRLMGTGFDATIVPSAEDMQQQSEEFSANLEEQMSNIPEYQGTQENLDRFEESNERGFDGDLAAMDEFDAQQEQEQADADLARTQIDLASEKPSVADRTYNTLLRAADSKAAQTYTKASDMLIDISKPITKIAADRTARKQRANMMNNAYLADNLFAATDADTSGNKGNYDPNTGLFRPDDKVVVGTTGSARFGGQFYKSGGAIDIDMNTYKQLVAAGADITIL